MQKLSFLVWVVQKLLYLVWVVQELIFSTYTSSELQFPVNRPKDPVSCVSKLLSSAVLGNCGRQSASQSVSMQLL